MLSDDVALSSRMLSGAAALLHRMLATFEYWYTFHFAFLELVIIVINQRHA